MALDQSKCLILLCHIIIINDHFSKNGHEGLSDIKIHVLDFVQLNPAFENANNLRLKIEQAWIHRLRTTFPDGLNYLD